MFNQIFVLWPHFVIYMHFYVDFSRLITSVWEKRADFLLSITHSFGVVFVGFTDRSKAVVLMWSLLPVLVSDFR